MFRKKGFGSYRWFLTLAATVLFGGNAWCLPEKPQLLNDVEQLSGTKLHYSVHEGTGMVRFLAPEAAHAVSGGVVAAMPSVSGKTPAAASETLARGFMGRFGTMFGISDQGRELAVKRTRVTNDGRSFVKFQQLHQGLPVIGGELVVQTDSRSNILSVHGEASPSPQVDVTPAIGAATAKEKALKAVAKYYGTEPAKLKASDPVLSIYNPVLLGPGVNTNKLVWKLEVTSADDGKPIREFVLIEAKRGFVALHFNQLDSVKNRTIYDNKNDSSLSLPGSGPVRTEGGGSTGTQDVDNAYDYTGDTYDFYSTMFGRDGIDGAGMPLISTVRYCDPDYACPYENAFWNGSQMVFGRGFASALDVVGHELTHGVTEHESGLYYYMQSGAINESLSDVFGEFVELSTDGQNITTDRWLMGEQLSMGAIRSMKDPTLFKNPDKMKSSYYYCGYSDGGGVHTNSGVNNKAAYLMTDGGTYNAKTITGLGIDKVAQIYYEAQTNLLTSGSDYGDLYDALQLACNNLVGNHSIVVADCAQVKNALDAVQMNQQPTACASPEAPVCAATGINPQDIFFDSFESGGGNWELQTLPGSPVASSNIWSLFNEYATDGIYSLYGYNYDNISDTAAALKNSVTLPAGAYLHFRHYYNFEFGYLTSDYPTLHYFDGGILEYSVDGGGSWTDALKLFDCNGYSTKTIQTGFENPLAGRRAFLGLSRGYVSSRLNLFSLAGKNAKFRFRIGTDNGTDSDGWLIDAVRLYTCQITSGSVSINNGADYAVKTSVTLNLTTSVAGGTGVQVRFSNDGTTWGAWGAYAATKPWTLSTGDGTKTVYAQFKHSSGAVSETYSDSIILDTTKPSGTLAITKIPGASPGIRLDWPGYTDALSGIKEYNLFYSPTAMPASCAGTLLLGHTQNTTFTSSDSSTTSNLVSGKYYYFRVCATDKAGNVSTGLTAKVMAASELDPPTGGVTINKGDAYTKTATVTLSLTASDVSGVAKMCVSNSNTPTCTATWTAVPTTAQPWKKSWTLPTTPVKDGLKTVSVWFMDKLENISAPYTATITLDTTAPTGTLAITKIPGTSPGIRLDWPGYTDALSGIKEYNLFYSPTAMPASCAGTRILGPTQNTTFTSSDSSTTSNLVSGKYYYYRVCATDKAGNVSPGLTAKVMAASEVVPPTGGVSIKPTTTNPDPNYTKTATVLLSLTSSASDLSKMCVSNTQTCTTWTAVPTTAQPWTKSWTLPTTPVKDGLKTVYVRFMDKLENISDPYPAQITLDTIKPTGTISIEGGAAITNNASVNLTLSCNDIDHINGCDKMRFSTTGTFLPAWESYSNSWSLTLAAPTVMGVKRVYVQYMDKAGNISLSSSDTITLTK